MPALVAGIHVGPRSDSMAGGWLCIVTNKANGTLYIGVTSNLPRRIHEYREELVDGFTKRHGLKRLVYYERFDSILDAIQREKTMKHWSRACKVSRIIDQIPEWVDLYDTLA